VLLWLRCALWGEALRVADGLMVFGVVVSWWARVGRLGLCCESFLRVCRAWMDFPGVGAVKVGVSACLGFGGGIA
jgi:hypothetical protein